MITHVKPVLLPLNFVLHVDLIQTDNIVVQVVVYVKQAISMEIYLYAFSVVINVMIV